MRTEAGLRTQKCADVSLSVTCAGVLQRNQSENTSWPENVENVQMFPLV